MLPLATVPLYNPDSFPVKEDDAQLLRDHMHKRSGTACCTAAH